MAATPSGKDKILRWTRVILGGYDLSGDARTFGTLANEFGEASQHGLNEALRNCTANGVRTIGVDGFQCLMNDVSNRSMDELKNPDAASRLSILFGGGGEPAIADLAYLLPSVQMTTDTGWDASMGVLTASFIMDQSQWDANTSNPMGVVLANQQYTANTSSASHDNGAATAKGWHANLHVTATAAGEYDIIIEDSANDADWVELDTFTANGSAVTSEHMSGAGAVDQWTRIRVARTAGTATIAVTFARN